MNSAMLKNEQGSVETAFYRDRSRPLAARPYGRLQAFRDASARLCHVAPVVLLFMFAYALIVEYSGNKAMEERTDPVDSQATATFSSAQLENASDWAVIFLVPMSLLLAGTAVFSLSKICKRLGAPETMNHQPERNSIPIVMMDVKNLRIATEILPISASLSETRPSALPSSLNIDCKARNENAANGG